MARQQVKRGWLSRSQEYDRPNSAYMLFYERADCLEPVTMMDEITAAAPREAASQAAGVPVADVTNDMSTSSTAEARPAHSHLLVCFWVHWLCPSMESAYSTLALTSLEWSA